MDNQNSHPQEEKPGLFAGVGGFAKNLLGLVMSRVELAALELSEVRTNLLKIVLVGTVGLLAAWFAVAFWSMLIVVLAWPTLGWKILLIIAAVFTVLAVALFFHIKSILDQGKLSMPATMAELRHDRDTLL